MKKILSYTLAVIGIILIGIQFIPTNLPAGSPALTGEKIQLPDARNEVMAIFKTSCFDCHSNQTVYTWYAHVAPASWLISSDVSKGREKLNFSDWSTYSKRKLVGKLDDIKEQVTKKEMPKPIYSFMHPNAKLNQSQISLIRDWADQETKKIMGE